MNQDFLKDSIQVNIGSMDLTANHNIQQIVEVCSDFEKRTKLIKHLDQISSENAKVLIFVGTKRIADDLTKYLRTDGWPALAIHGDKEQYVSGCYLWESGFKPSSRRERDWVLGEFKAGRSPILIATDVASRGLGTYIHFSASAAARWSFHLSDKTITSGHVVFFAYLSRDSVRFLGYFEQPVTPRRRQSRFHTCTHQIIPRFPDSPRTEIALEVFYRIRSNADLVGPLVSRSGFIIRNVMSQVCLVVLRYSNGSSIPISIWTRWRHGNIVNVLTSIVFTFEHHAPSLLATLWMCSSETQSACSTLRTFIDSFFFTLAALTCRCEGRRLCYSKFSSYFPLVCSHYFPELWFPE